MQSSNAPSKLKLPFAASGAKNTIPNTSQIGIVAGAASYPDGFPPLTRTPLVAGGVPPSGTDMNGVLFEMTAIARWLASGTGFAYDSAWASDALVGGYPKGARVLRTDGVGYWLNTAENNTTDPEAGGAGWVPDFTNGIATVAMSGANVTLTPLQYGKPIIQITGTLTANLNLIFPTGIVGEWTVLNDASGSYTVTCKTAAGTGVVVSSAQVVVGDGTNIRSAVSGAAALAVDNSIQDFRLTLTTGTPVTTVDVTAATALLFTPYSGNRIALYDGTEWNMRTSLELTIAVPAVANTMHDVFIYDNAGTPALELLAWTNDTTRATALARQDGRLVKSGAPTRRYVGSFRTLASGQTEDSFSNRLVWNYDNRVLRQGRGTFSTDRATTSTTYVELNSEIRIGFVVGVSEDAIFAATTGSVQGDANRWAGTAYAFDGTTAEPGLEGGAVAAGALGAGIRGNCAVTGYKVGIAAGYHYATIIGKTDTGTCTWQSATTTLGAKFYSTLGIQG